MTVHILLIVIILGGQPVQRFGGTYKTHEKCEQEATRRVAAIERESPGINVQGTCFEQQVRKRQ